jgi:hypothetical protein
MKDQHHMTEQTFGVEEDATEDWLALWNRDLGEVIASGCREPE